MWGQFIADACSKLYAAAAPPTRKLALSGQTAGLAPSDTLTAAQSLAKYPWYEPERAFALLAEFYPIPHGKTMRPVPHMPYLNFPPSAWVLPLKFDGGGYRAGGKAMFHKHMEMNLTEAYAFATRYMAGAMASEDAREGIDAFIGKRPMPDWKGR